MSEVLKIIKKYPQFLLGLFVIYSISYNQPFDFFVKSFIGFWIIYYLLYQSIQVFAAWSYLEYDNYENILGKMLFIFSLTGLVASAGFIFSKILLSSIWDVLFSTTTYVEKIRFILNDKILCYFAILILLLRLLWLSADEVQKN